MAAKVLHQADLSRVDTSDVEGVGVEYEAADGAKYRWVYNAESASTIAAHQPVCFDADNSASAGFSFLHNVHVPDVAADTFLFAGVSMVSASASTYFWVQKKGYHSAALVGGETISAMTPLYVTSAGSSTRFSKIDSADGYQYVSKAILLQAQSTLANGAFDVFVDAL